VKRKFVFYVNYKGMTWPSSTRPLISGRPGLRACVRAKGQHFKHLLNWLVVFRQNCGLRKCASHFTANVTFSYVDVYCADIPLLPWDAYIMKVYKHVRLWLNTLSWLVVIKIGKNKQQLSYCVKSSNLMKHAHCISFITWPWFYVF